MEVLDIAQALINTKFYQGKDNEELINLLCSFFKDAEEMVPVIDSNGLPHLLIGLNCKLENLSNAILLSGHMDTIRPEENWKTDAKIENDLLYGLGSTDMKSFFAAIIANQKEIKNLTTPVVLSITSDEETIGEGIKAILQEMNKRDIHPNYALVGEPTENKVITSNRGNYVHIISLTGKECHSMNPKNGINALYAASHIINYIEQLQNQYQNSVSLNPIIVDGGKMPNQVCGHCLIKLSIRTASKALHDEIEAKIQGKINEVMAMYKLPNVEFEKVFELSAFEKNGSEFNTMLCEFLNSEEGEYLATTEAGELQNYGIPNISIIGPGNLNLAHKENEYCSVSELLAYTNFLPEMLKKVSKQLNAENALGGEKR